MTAPAEWTTIRVRMLHDFDRAGTAPRVVECTVPIRKGFARKTATIFWGASFEVDLRTRRFLRTKDPRLLCWSMLAADADRVRAVANGQPDPAPVD
jgi:hypothetical protein